MARFPLLVQFAYHPASEEATSVADYLHESLNDDPAVPGLRIPTLFIPIDGSDAPPTAALSDSDRVVVVLLADDYLASHARRPTSTGTTWAEYVVRLRELCDQTPAHRFLPVQLTQHGWPTDSRLSDLNFLRAWSIDGGSERRKFIARRLVHLLIRRLHPDSTNDDAPPLTIFLSHAKFDLDSEPKVVRNLLGHLTASQPEKTWFDSGDIASGSQFAREIEKGVKDAALLAILTDSYSSRSWCRREVLFAKRHERPVVVVDAVQEREVRSFPYGGNVPVIRWNGNARDAVDLLLRESLRHLNDQACLDKIKRPDDVVLPFRPELVTLVHREKQHTVLYPDPPLGAEELAIIDAAGVKVETPLERHAFANASALKNVTVALSTSAPSDIGRFGLRRSHYDSALIELSRYLLVVGARLAYGGHLMQGGYTVRLADLLRDPIVEQLRGQTPSTDPQLVVFLPWPTLESSLDEAKLGPLVEVRHCDRPPDIDETLDSALTARPSIDVPTDSVPRRFAWARGLTEMRTQQVTETSARIVIGGMLDAQTGFKGRLPGVLEEAIATLEAKRPLFVIGAFGGCASVIFRALEGKPCPELAWAVFRSSPQLEELRSLFAQRKQAWIEFDDIAPRLAGIGLAGLNNGLTQDENRELAVTRAVDRMVELVLTGLQRLNPTPVGSNS